ncbi:hypothetical protein MKW94_004556 [Papaver nudicaule]|uniref:Zinc finger protein n=1 Tax=Papaver nudicaule TaxID=74823 RepID=A0AA42AUE1_PAPNU|nr:hypothetical protein [Papaver nudicaule]
MEQNGEFLGFGGCYWWWCGGDGDEFSYEECQLLDMVEVGGSDNSTISTVRVNDAPILMFVSFHKAFRAELVELHRIASSFLEINGFPGRDLILDLLRRFRFLQVVYKYHSAAEDEVIFKALDGRVKNVEWSYYRERRTIDDLFESVFRWFNSSLEADGKFALPVQELVNRGYSLQASICQHMRKEEDQVFPLLIQLFSLEEQASFVWRLISSVPIMLLEDMLPWMASYLPKTEQEDFALCIKAVIPKENLLQKVLISWLVKKRQPTSKAFSIPEIGNWVFNSYEPFRSKEFPKAYLSGKSVPGKICSGIKSDCAGDIAKHHPINVLHLWHSVISRGLNKILEELQETRGSRTSSHLSSLCSQLKFFVDVLIFYSAALEKVFFSELNELVDEYSSFSYGRFPDGSQIEGLFEALQNISSQNTSSFSSHLEKLGLQLVSFIEGISAHFAFQESEVFPLIRKHCNSETQQSLLYESLQVMPLGLLKCAISWLSTHLTEDESNAISCSITWAGSVSGISFSSVLNEWVHTEYSGKSTIEKFRQEIHYMFKSMRAFLVEDLEVHQCQKSHSGQGELESYSALYSSEMNMQIFFPEALRKIPRYSIVSLQISDADSKLTQEFKPFDFLFLFHKALKSDIEYLIVVSGKMDINLKLLKEFLQRFHLVRFLYKIHCDSEDEIVFPAVEAMAKFHNISSSYSIDHKLEKELLSDVTDILYKICELHVTLPAETPSVLDGRPDQRILNYRHMCTKLHGMCKMMRIALEKHVYHDEIQVWSLFSEFFSYEEQEKIIGRMLGRIRAESLQVMLPWLMTSLSPSEQHGILSILFKTTKNTMFSEWLAEWWEGIDKSGMTAIDEEFDGWPSRAEEMNLSGRISMFRESASDGVNARLFTKDTAKRLNRKLKNFQHPEFNGEDEKSFQEVISVKDQVEKPAKVPLEDETFRHDENHLLNMSHEDSVVEIRRMSHDITRSVDSSQQTHHQEVACGSVNGEIPGHYPSYQDEAKGTFGCKHYKRNCKLFASCCNQFFTCIHCHDESVLDHTMDRESTTEMMCMKCMKVQPIGPACANISCDEFSMAKYFCGICKLYDDDREIYHCPFCNICRVGKGLGIDYCHCMTCNTCLSSSFSTHICREKSFESNCPICQEYIFTSRSPVRALPCGHLMHSKCFQEYTCTQYTCPICSKSLGNMKVYFKMIDDLLAEEILPEEYSEMTQDILCHDCEKKGVASFHWLHHKCSHCASYNTRIL